MKRNVLLGLIAALATQPALAQGEAVPPAATVLETGNDLAMRMTVPVMVNGQGPFQFFIDTGADRTVISEELADRLGLKDLDKARLHAMSGVREVRVVEINTLQVSNNVARKVKAAALPARHLGGDGLLGIDSLENQRIVMDFKARTIEILPSSKGDKQRVDEQGMIVVTAKTRLGQLVMVDADANGQKVWVVVDTGAQNSVGNIRLKGLMLKRKNRPETKPIQMTDVLGRTTEAEYALVGRMRFGDVTISNAAIAFVDAHPFKLFELHKKPSMLLGMESLRNFDKITVDFPNRKVKFLLPKPLVEIPAFPAN
jgi:predicted aspartyl protease